MKGPTTLSQMDQALLEAEIQLLQSKTLKLHRFGWIGTVAWLAVVTAYGVASLWGQEVVYLRLNEFGDFAAGVSGPLAFLWLVIGYFQQGNELQQNTLAMRLQVHELRQSVEQQTELVRTTEAAAKQARESFAYAKRAEKVKNQLIIVRDVGELTIKEGQARHSIKLGNAGCIVSDVVFSAEQNEIGLNFTNRRHHPTWNHGQQHVVGLAYPQATEVGKTAKLVVSYQDGLGEPEKQILLVSRIAKGIRLQVIHRSYLGLEQGEAVEIDES